ncbi:hypothetical protein VNO78_15736 [Psophocarpus tetragonolobus]|uniref:Uncharacterized protein n=1 Tax=Psophocarpus tetragonolobus TaxID=3891 RepID=A0AAN9XK18_PSOTE
MEKLVGRFDFGGPTVVESYWVILVESPDLVAMTREASMEIKVDTKEEDDNDEDLWWEQRRGGRGGSVEEEGGDCGVFNFGSLGLLGKS